MKRIALAALVALLPLTTHAIPPGWLRRPNALYCPSTGQTCPVATNPAQNAVLYASFATPGCYASGSTALAVDGSGSPVAMTFSRASSAYYISTPTGASNAVYWNTCTSNQLRVGGLWYGANLEPPGNNLFLTPTDSPTSSGNWALIAAGSTMTANSTGATFIDGTQTSTKFTASAGTISGFGPSANLTLTANPYFFNGFFYSDFNSKCWGLSVGGTVWAKWDIMSGAATYNAPNFVANATPAGQGWVWVSAYGTATAGAQAIHIFATDTCTDGVEAATANSYTTYISRVAFSRRSDSFSFDQPYSYVAAGSSRAAELLYFPLTSTPLASGNVCLTAVIEPMNSPWNSRLNTANVAGLVQATNSAPGSANSMYAQMNQDGTAACTVYDNAAAAKFVVFNNPRPPSLLPSLVFYQANSISCCTDTSGNVTVGLNGAFSKQMPLGAGTGILTTPPSYLMVGTNYPTGAGAGQATSSVAVSDLAVCNVSNGQQCGVAYQPTVKDDAVVGDSISVSPGWVTGSDVTAVWPAVAGNIAGRQIASIGRASWYTIHAVTGFVGPGAQGARGHRYRKIAVAVGINDVNTSYGTASMAFNNLLQIYKQILGEGAIPIPMTVLPTSLSNGTMETERQTLNKAILNWCTWTGYACADAATFMDDGTYGGTPGRLRVTGVNWDSGDHIHPNQLGETALGTFMAPYFN